ncbi:MAG: tetratricopeptide repeat protein [Desulfobulbaceae bacterium]|nr:tetratricopeptide repeat protein [Desulfobulbaceae bacterium]
MEPRRNDPCPCGSGQKYKKCCAETAAGPGSDQLGQAAGLVRQGEVRAATELFVGAEALARDLAGAHYHLGVALGERGLAGEAAACYRQTLATCPDHVEALNNLGAIRKAQKDFPGAADLLRHALQLRPDAAIIHYNLGVVLVELGHDEEAHLCFTQALKLRPDYVEAHYNLGVVLMRLNCAEEARLSFTRALELRPDYVEAHYNLGMLAREAAAWASAAAHLRRAVELRPDYPRAQAELAILTWMHGDFTECAFCLEQISLSRRKLSAEEQKFVAPYREFLGKLLDYRRDHGDLYASNAELPELYVIGDSHCLTPAHLQVVRRNTAYRVEARIVVGAKAWHLGRPQPNRYQRSLAKIIAALPTGAPVVVLFGEIDCRLDEGIIPHQRKTGSDLSLAIPELVENYLTNLAQLFGAKSIRPMFANVPAPNRQNGAVPDTERQHQAFVIQEFNRALAASCAARNFPIVDTYGASIWSEGLAQGQGHLDMFHLEPVLYKRLLEALPE